MWTVVYPMATEGKRLVYGAYGAGENILAGFGVLTGQSRPRVFVSGLRNSVLDGGEYFSPFLSEGPLPCTGELGSMIVSGAFPRVRT
jgi:hypothetical protein